MAKNLLFNVHTFPSRKIKKPKWSNVQEYWILSLDKAIVSNNKHAPICIARNVPKNKVKNPFYFTWKEKYYLDSKNEIWAIIYHLIIKKERKYLRLKIFPHPSYYQCFN